MSTEPFLADPDIAKRFSIVVDYVKKKHDIDTQSKLAAIFNLSQPLMSLVIKGKRAVTIDMLKVLFIRFNINPLFVILGGDEKIEYRKEDKTLITDTRELRTEIVMLSARMQKMEQDLRILSQKQL